MLSSEKLTENNLYTRRNLQDIFNIKDASLKNGVFRPAGYKSIWLFITEKKAKDRPQLYDLLCGDTLYWDGQPEGRTDKLIIEHDAADLELLVFYRKHKNEFPNFGFRYEGRFRYISHTKSRPTQFILQRIKSILYVAKKDIEALKIEEASEPYYFREGKSQLRLTNTHERNPRLRAEAIKIHGVRCYVCDFSFSEAYGPLGNGFIEIHHLRPVAEYTEETLVDPSNDMLPLCANCHRMIHRNPDKLLSPDELRTILKANTASHENK
ncbi:HNH endonuclease [Ktedonosporobacter rubrisoli]|nr:HNH endonuclease [Ktedonosporobacter rubrisoli]